MKSNSRLCNAFALQISCYIPKGISKHVANKLPPPKPKKMRIIRFCVDWDGNMGLRIDAGDRLVDFLANGVPKDPKKT